MTTLLSLRDVPFCDNLSLGGQSFKGQKGQFCLAG